VPGLGPVIEGRPRPMLDHQTTSPTHPELRALVDERSQQRWMNRSPKTKAVKQISTSLALSASDCAAFLACAKRDDFTPCRVLRSFIEAFAEGQKYPPPRPLISASGKCTIWGIIPKEILTRATDRAREESFTISAILRGYVAAYIHEGDGEAD
jgi:hypothetical protein